MFVCHWNVGDKAIYEKLIVYINLGSHPTSIMKKPKMFHTFSAV